MTNTGLLTISNGTIVSLSGALSQPGTGGVALGGAVTSSDSISFAGSVSLTAVSSLDTSAGSGNVTLSQTVNGAFGLTLKAGTGTVDIQGEVGGSAPPTSISLQGSSGITLNSSMTVAGPFTITSAGGTTLFNGALTASGNVSLGVSALTLNRTITTTAAGSIAITNSGAFSLSSGAIPLTSATTFTQSGGGSVALGMNIMTAGNLQFGSNITLTDPVTMNSGGGALTLANVNGANNLILIAGGGSITLGALGGTTPLANVTIQSAANVTAGAMTGNSTSKLTQTAGSGLTHFTGALSFGSSGISLTGSQFTFDGTVDTSGVGAVSMNHSGLLTMNSGSVATIGGTFTESGGGAVTTAANITSSGQNISFADPITLSGAVTLNSAGGDIILSNTVGGGFDLLLTAGAGLIQLDGAVSGLSSLTASGVSIFQNTSVSTSGIVAETGAITLANSITTSGSPITLTGNVTTSASIVLTAGVGNIHITGTLNGNTSGRNFTASSSGSVTFDSAVGALVPFNNFTVNGNTIAMANFGSASPAATGTAAFTAVGAMTFNGTTYRNGVQNYTAGTNFNFNAGALTTISSSNQAITFSTGTMVLSTSNDLTVNSNGGNITLTTLTAGVGGQNVTVNAGAGNVTVAGMATMANPLNDVVLTGTVVTHPDTIWANSLTINSPTITTISANLNTPGVDHTYNGPVIISGASVTLTVGNLTFNESLDANTAGNALTITTGAGDSIIFNGSVGGATPLSSIVINPTMDVTASGAFHVGSFSQTGGTGTTTFSGGLTASASGGISIEASSISLGGSISSAGPTSLTGALTATGISAASSGNFTQTGTSNISGTITTTDSPIEFTGALTLGGDLTLNSVSSTGASIQLDSTVDGANSLTLNAGTGNLALSGAVGNAVRLSTFQISSAGNVTSSNIIKAASILQSAGTGTTTLANLNTNTVNGINLIGNAFILNGVFTTTSGGPLIITNSGNLSLTASASTALNGNLTQNGSGAVTALSGPFTVDGAVSFSSAVAIPTSTTLNLDTSAANQNITFSNTIAGPGALTLNLGTGSLTMSGAASGLGAFSVPAVGPISTAAIGASSITIAATGDAILNGNLSSTAGVVSLTGTTMTITGALSTTGGAFSIVNSGLLRLTTGAGGSIAGGAFSQSGGGLVQLSGAISTVNQNLSFADPIKLQGTASLSTSGTGVITLSSIVDGPFSLDLTTGSGAINFGDNLGPNIQLGALTIHSVGGITYPSVNATSIVQLANSGSTTITGPLTSSGSLGISLIGAAVTQNGNITALGTGPFSIQHSGTFIMSSGTLTTVTGGSYLDSASSVGSVTLAGSILTANAPISFLGSGVVTLGDDLTLNTGATGANITFATAITGAHNMTLSAKGGSVAFNGAININDLTITSANNVTTKAITATAITQSNGSGLTHFQGVLSTNASGGIALVGTAFTFDANVTTTGSGPVSITNTGTLTIASATNWSVAGSLRQLGSGSTVLGGNATANGAILFAGPVATTGTPSLNSTSNPISFASTLDGPGGVTLVAGTGDVVFDSAIGGLTPFGALSITSAANVTVGREITAASITQSAGSGLSTFTGDLNTSGSSGINLTGTMFTFQGNVTTAASSTGPIMINNSGTLMFAAESSISSDGAFTQSGAGSVSIGGSLTANNALIAFAGPITMSSSSTFSSGTGNITLSSSIDGSSAASQDLTLTAGGTSTITVNAVGQTIPLGAFVTDGYNVTQIGHLTALSYTLTSTGTAMVGTNSIAVNTITNGPEGTHLTFNNSVRHGNTTTTNGGPLIFFISGTATGHAGNTGFLDGPFSLIGPGTVNVGATITTTNHPIFISGTLNLLADYSLNTGSGGGDITINGTMNGAHNLILSAGAGNIVLGAVFGGSIPLSSIQIASASTFAVSAISAHSLTLSGITSLATFNGPLNISGPISLTGFGFAFNSSVTTTSGGSLTLANTGPFTFPSDGATISLDGVFNQTTLGSVSIGGSLTTSDHDVTFNGPISLSGDLTIDTGSGVGDVTIVNDIEGTHALTVHAGTGDVAFQLSFSLEEPLTSLTVTGQNISLSGIGESGVGITDAMTLTAEGDINLTSSFYNAASQTYSAAGNTSFNNNSTMSLVSQGPISFTSGGILLSSGSNLSITTNSGHSVLANLTASSPENLTIDVGAGSLTLSSIGGGVSDVIVNAGEIFFSGEITANNTTFTSLGSIRNLTVPVAIGSTNTAFFNAVNGNVGSLASPILVNTSDQIIAGACGTCLAAFNGSSIDDTVQPYAPNPPCVIYFNGVKIKDCGLPPIPPGPAPMHGALKGSRFFAVVGVYNSQFNYANDYYFFIDFLDEKYWRRSIPVYVKGKKMGRR